MIDIKCVVPGLFNALLDAHEDATSERRNKTNGTISFEEVAKIAHFSLNWYCCRGILFFSSTTSTLCACEWRMYALC